jgi:3-oxoacyl-[acyl-carrier protein] reductase
VLLDGKNAIVYGAAGSIGTAVSRAFAREGATVHLAGRTRARVEELAERIRAEGGKAETAQVDALDEGAVDEHADSIGKRFGSIDVSINLISTGDVQGTPLAEMSLADYERPIHNAVRTTFLTSRAAARHMIKQRSGVLLFWGGEGLPLRDYYIGGFQVSLGAVDTFRKQLAAELGPHGIRVVSLLTGGIPEAIPMDEAAREGITDMLVGATMLGRTATLEDVGNVAVFAASDRAASITAATINMTVGAEIT